MRIWNVCRKEMHLVSNVLQFFCIGHHHFARNSALLLSELCHGAMYFGSLKLSFGTSLLAAWHVVSATLSAMRIVLTVPHVLSFCQCVCHILEGTNLWCCELPSGHLLLACKEWMELLFLLLVFARHYRNSCIRPLTMHLRLLNISLFVNGLHSLCAVPLSACSGHLSFVILQFEVCQLQMFACFWDRGFAG